MKNNIKINYICITKQLFYFYFLEKDKIKQVQNPPNFLFSEQKIHLKLHLKRGENLKNFYGTKRGVSIWKINVLNVTILKKINVSFIVYFRCGKHRFSFDVINIYHQP